MQKVAHWVLDGEIARDAGDWGGDIQVGPAFQARFRSDDCPEARFEYVAYATAKQYMDVGETDPDCPHERVTLEHLGDNVAQYAPMPEEHLACQFKPGTVDVQAQSTYRMNGHVDEDGAYESDDSDDIAYEWVGSDLGYTQDTLAKQIQAATEDARRHIEDFAANVNKYLHWDGRTRPKG